MIKDLAASYRFRQASTGSPLSEKYLDGNRSSERRHLSTIWTDENEKERKRERDGTISSPREQRKNVSMYEIDKQRKKFLESSTANLDLVSQDKRKKRSSKSSIKKKNKNSDEEEKIKSPRTSSRRSPRGDHRDDPPIKSPRHSHGYLPSTDELNIKDIEGGSSRRQSLTAPLGSKISPRDKKPPADSGKRSPRENLREERDGVSKSSPREREQLTKSQPSSSSSSRSTIPVPLFNNNTREYLSGGQTKSLNDIPKPQDHRHQTPFKDTPPSKENRKHKNDQRQ